MVKGGENFFMQVPIFRIRNEVVENGKRLNDCRDAMPKVESQREHCVPAFKDRSAQRL